MKKNLAGKVRADLTSVGGSCGRLTLPGCQTPSQLFSPYTFSTGKGEKLK